MDISYSPPKPAKNNLPDFHGKHILLADDEEVNQIVTTKMLTAQNAIVSSAGNGYEVLQLLENGLRPDLILLDLKMPELDGFSTVQKIKELYPYMVVLAYSASSYDNYTEPAIKEKGFDGILPKTFKPEIFYQKLAEVLL